MYNKKYRLISIDRKDISMVKHLFGKDCYIAYLKIGEFGWFLCDTKELDNPMHRIRTSIVKQIDYGCPNKVVVWTENSKYIFEEIKE